MYKYIVYSYCTLSYEPGTEQPGMCKGLAKSSLDLPADLALAGNDDDDYDDDDYNDDDYNDDDYDYDDYDDDDYDDDNYNDSDLAENGLR